MSSNRCDNSIRHLQHVWQLVLLLKFQTLEHSAEKQQLPLRLRNDNS